MELIKVETLIIQEFSGVGGPSNPNEWYCDVSKISFSLRKMKEVAEAQVLGDKVILQTNQKDAMV